MTTNRPWRRWAAALLAAGLARAQDSGELEWAVAWVEAVAELSSKERFGPEDLASFLEHYASFQELGTAEDRGRKRSLREGKCRFELVLKHKPYLDWAKARLTPPAIDSCAPMSMAKEGGRRSGPSSRRRRGR